MREGTPVDPNLSLADMLPPDKADESRILQAGFALVEALSRRAPSAGYLTVTVTLDAAGWGALEVETRRPYRGHAAYKYTPHPGGAGAVRWTRATEAQQELEALRQRVDRTIVQLTEELRRLHIEARWDGDKVTLRAYGGSALAAERPADPCGHVHFETSSLLRTTTCLDCGNVFPWVELEAPRP